MSEIQAASSVASNVWPRMATNQMPGPSRLPNVPPSLPIVENPNLRIPMTTFPGGYPSLQQGVGLPNNLPPNNYGLSTMLPPQMPAPANQLEAIRNEANNRRLKQLEEENSQRRTATLNLQQMGAQLLKSQMDVQEQILQYQFMLEQCMETLNHQNFILEGQIEELALLRSKMRYYESIMDAIKQRQDKNPSHPEPSEDWYRSAACHNLFNAFPTSSSPPHEPPRHTAAKFQPFNMRYRSPTNERAAGGLNR